MDGCRFVDSVVFLFCDVASSRPLFALLEHQRLALRLPPFPAPIDSGAQQFHLPVLFYRPFLGSLDVDGGHLVGEFFRPNVADNVKVGGVTSWLRTKYLGKSSGTICRSTNRFPKRNSMANRFGPSFQVIHDCPRGLSATAQGAALGLLKYCGTPISGHKRHLALLPGTAACSLSSKSLLADMILDGASAKF